MDGLRHFLQFRVVELQIAVLVELDQHGRGEQIVEAPEVPQRLHRLVGIDDDVEPGFGEDMRMHARGNRRGEEGNEPQKRA